MSCCTVRESIGHPYLRLLVVDFDVKPICLDLLANRTIGPFLKNIGRPNQPRTQETSQIAMARLRCGAVAPLAEAQTVHLSASPTRRFPAQAAHSYDRINSVGSRS